VIAGRTFANVRATPLCGMRPRAIRRSSSPSAPDQAGLVVRAAQGFRRLREELVQAGRGALPRALPLIVESIVKRPKLSWLINLPRKGGKSAEAALVTSQSIQRSTELF